MKFITRNSAKFEQAKTQFIERDSGLLHQTLQIPGYKRLLSHPVMGELGAVSFGRWQKVPRSAYNQAKEKHHSHASETLTIPSEAPPT